MAGTTGLEPATSAVTGQRSNQLSYVPSYSQYPERLHFLQRFDTRSGMHVGSFKGTVRHAATGLSLTECERFAEAERRGIAPVGSVAYTQGGHTIGHRGC